MALVGYSLWRKDAGFKSIIFLPPQFNSLTFPNLTPVLGITMVAQNTSNQNFTVRALSAKAFCDGKYIGTVYNFNAQVIPPTSAFPLKLYIQLSLIGIAIDVVTAIQDKEFSKTIQLQGSANVDGLQLPITESFDVGI